MKCCTLPDGGHEGGGKHHKPVKHHKRVTKLAVAAGECAGKKAKAFRKCVKAHIKRMR